MQTKHTTEQEARETAQKLGDESCQIVESNDNHAFPEKGAAVFFYVESGDNFSLIRNWERLVYSGPGKGA